MTGVQTCALPIYDFAFKLSIPAILSFMQYFVVVVVVVVNSE